MNLLPLEQINKIQSTQEQQSPDALRRAATQFEAVLLMKLTAALNETNEDDENALFGSDGGSGLAKQMFSEQLATSMAQSGGVGLSDIIMKQLGGIQPKTASVGVRSLAGARTAVKDIRDEAFPISSKGIAGNLNDAEIVSTFENDLRTNGIDDSLANLILDGRVVNTTRPRLAPTSKVTEIQPVVTKTFSSPFSDFSDSKVKFRLPVNGRISSGFGNRVHPIDQKIKFHAGIDIAVPIGTPVGSAASGVVKFAGRDGNYGNLIIVAHPDGTETRYGHLSELLVSESDEVSAGQPIALSGSTGKSTGPHVHFEVRENGQVVNPLKVLSNVLPINAER